MEMDRDKAEGEGKLCEQQETNLSVNKDGKTFLLSS